MNIQIPSALTGIDSTQTAIDAVYCVVRTLLNVARGSRIAQASSELSPQAKALAQDALREIGSLEGQSIADVDKQRLFAYVEALDNHVRDQYLQTTTADTAQATRVLAEMRQTRTRLSRLRRAWRVGRRPEGP